jgi:hypothetical protein
MGQANHVIVCVPFVNDTIWLECTSQEYPFGFIGSGNNDRYVILVTENGGKLVRTPDLSKHTNVQIRNATVLLDEQGNATTIVSTKFSGLQFGNRNFLLGESKEDQKKWYLNYFDFNSPVFNSFELSESGEGEPGLLEELNIYLPKYSTVTGNRMFIKPNILNSSSPPIKSKNRKFDLALDFAYTDIDTIIYKVSKGFVLESAMEDVSVESEFGRYSASIINSDDQLVYIRKVEINKGVWPPEKYNEFQSFFSTMWKSDQNKVVFVRK